MLEIETVSKLIPLFDNYIPDQRQTEDVTPEESQEEDEFISSIMATHEMRIAYELLHTKGGMNARSSYLLLSFLGNNSNSIFAGVFQSSYDDFAAHVKKLWFGIFNRGGGTKSSRQGSFLTPF